MGKTIVFQDPDFRPTAEAIYEIKYNGNTYQGGDIGSVVEWRRLKDLTTFRKATDGRSNIRLFEDGVRAADINQGSLGDCWLLSSLACLATRSGTVEKLFLTPEYNEEGKYQLRLWNKYERRYQEIIIDDNVPVWRQGGQPCFAHPHGNEAWVLLLEKAMAKYVGNYHFLDGGVTSWALETLTGHYTCVFLLEQKFGANKQAGPDQESWRWLRAELATRTTDRVVAFGSRTSPLNRNGMYTYDDSDPAKFYSHEEVFMAIVYHLAIGNLVAAATVGTDDDKDVEGVVRAHAYTVMAAQPVNSKSRGELLMVQVRNPHGSGGLEWSGDWSDQSPLWFKHPEVSEAVGYLPAPSSSSLVGSSSRGGGGGSSSTDGCFWMEWRDFVKHFKEVTFCCANGFDYLEGDEAGWVEVFNDLTFPHDHRSLGDYKFILNSEPKTGLQLDEIIKWLRLKEIAAPEQFRTGVRGLKLFAGGGTHPDDIDGGSTGLMTAVACLANKPGAVEELFVSGKEYRPDGSYQVRLYEPTTGAASIAPFDDWIPCYNTTPITKTKILGSEVWVLLLEKAVARLVGSYSKVSMWGVQVCWALACLAGQYTCMLMWEDKPAKWRRLELHYVEKNPAQYKAEYMNDDQSLMANDDVFKTLDTQLLLGCLIAAETDKKEVAAEVTGLAPARYYSVLEARLAVTGGRTLRMVKLRDPARQNEWKGDWSDGSDKWLHFPRVAEILGFHGNANAVVSVADGGDSGEGGQGGGASSSQRRDGSFWMTFEDFLLYFRHITLCGNSLRGNQKPWVAGQAELDAAARRLEEARRQQALRAEQEALEDSQHAELRKRAKERARGPSAGVVFAQAAITAAANAPQRQPLPAPSASHSRSALAPATSGTRSGGAAAAAAVEAGEVGSVMTPKPIVEVVPESKSGPCKSCSIM